MIHYITTKTAPEAQASWSLHPYQLLQSINRAERIEAQLPRCSCETHFQNPSLVLALKLAHMHAQIGDSAAVLRVLKPVDFLSAFMIEERALVRQVAQMARTWGC